MISGSKQTQVEETSLENNVKIVPLLSGMTSSLEQISADSSLQVLDSIKNIGNQDISDIIEKQQQDQTETT